MKRELCSWIRHNYHHSQYLSSNQNVFHFSMLRMQIYNSLLWFNSICIILSRWVNIFYFFFHFVNRIHKPCICFHFQPFTIEQWKYVYFVCVSHETYISMKDFHCHLWHSMEKYFHWIKTKHPHLTPFQHLKTSTKINNILFYIQFVVYFMCIFTFIFAMSNLWIFSFPFSRAHFTFSNWIIPHFTIFNTMGRVDKLDTSFSRSRSSSMSSLENISTESITCLAFADSYTKKLGEFFLLSFSIAN